MAMYGIAVLGVVVHHWLMADTRMPVLQYGFTAESSTVLRRLSPNRRQTDKLRRLCRAAWFISFRCRWARKDPFKLDNFLYMSAIVAKPSFHSYKAQQTRSYAIITIYVELNYNVEQLKLKDN